VRILVISNLYPPYVIGGYELGCRDVVDVLKARGNDVTVLTSTYGLARRQVDNGIHRWLHENLPYCPTPQRGLEYRVPNLQSIVRQQWQDQRAFQSLVKARRPDIVLVFNLSHIAATLPPLAKRFGLPIAFYVSDDWFATWSPGTWRNPDDPWFHLWSHQPQRVLSKLIKPILSRILHRARIITKPEAFDCRHVVFCSQFLKNAAVRSGKSVSNAAVIHWGIDLRKYSFNQIAQTPPTRLLYVGQVVPHKGVKTAIDAVRILHTQYNEKEITLQIVGGSVMPEYLQQLKDEVRASGFEKSIEFCGLVSRDQVAEFYRRNDIFIFPSIWEEPFSIGLLEAMASGLAVVGTATGGSPEILVDEYNGLVFQKEDANACAAQLHRLLSDHQLFTRVRANARDTVEKQFQFDDMVDAIELFLKQAISENGN